MYRVPSGCIPHPTTIPRCCSSSRPWCSSTSPCWAPSSAAPSSSASTCWLAWSRWGLGRVAYTCGMMKRVGDALYGLRVPRAANGVVQGFGRLRGSPPPVQGMHALLPLAPSSRHAMAIEGGVRCPGMAAPDLHLHMATPTAATLWGPRRRAHGQLGAPFSATHANTTRCGSVRLILFW